eukprot:m.119396 g.119396  ORF g.119396 m.119396 type:complete len:239 (-) comp12907_c0_seq8:245-961(-)
MLTEAVRRKPYSIVLLDEFEKAHREVSNLLLQVLDDGHLTDSQGHKVDFTNTIIVMTSNIGADIIAESSIRNASADTYDAVSHIVDKKVREHFSPEFVNRIGDIVTFNRLSRADMDAILQIRLKEVALQLAENEIRVEVTPSARKWLCDSGYDPTYGARPLNRVIRQKVMVPIARSVLAGHAHKDTLVVVDVKKEGGADGGDSGNEELVIIATDDLKKKDGNEAVDFIDDNDVEVVRE